MSNVPRVGSTAQMQSYADAGGLAAVLRHMSHTHVEVTTALHIPPTIPRCVSLSVVTHSHRVLLQVRMIALDAMGAFASTSTEFRDAAIVAGAVAKLVQVRVWQVALRVVVVVRCVPSK